MHPSLWISKSGLDGQQTNISVISNNLANVNTTGYKKSHAVFQDLMYQKIRQPGAEIETGVELPSGLMIGTGTRITSTQKDFRAGNPLHTDNDLHLAINGRGFFQILQTDGTIAYSRDGQFTLNETGQVVNSEGLLIQPAITIPADATSITIAKDGMVSVKQPGSVALTQVGSLQLAAFVNPTGLEPAGGNLYLETQASGAPIIGTPGTNGIGAILQNTLESSNVNVVEELVNLIQTQRAYEMNAKSVESADGMLRFVAQVL